MLHLRLRQLLNVESGLNDGLALPVVVVLLAMASRAHVHALEVAWELARWFNEQAEEAEEVEQAPAST